MRREGAKDSCRGKAGGKYRYNEKSVRDYSRENSEGIMMVSGMEFIEIGMYTNKESIEEK